MQAVKPVHSCVSASLDGFPPCVWGPPLWHVLYTFAFNYPEASADINENDDTRSLRRRGYAHFFSSLASVLPCSACRYHYKAHLHQLLEDPDPTEDMLFTSRRSVVVFVHTLHSRVSSHTQKVHGSTSQPPSLPELIAMYEKLRVKQEPRAADHVDYRCVVRIVPVGSTEPSFLLE